MLERVPLLFLIRHGQTDYNLQRRFQGHAQVPLNSEGRKQAARVAEILANILRKYKLVINAFSSDLVRAFETAEIVQHVVSSEIGLNFSIEQTKALREFHVGLFENHTTPELEKLFPEMVRDYFTEYAQNPLKIRYPGEFGESREMVARRLLPLLNLISANISTTGTMIGDNNNLTTILDATPEIFLFVSHGGTLDVLLEILLGNKTSSKRILGNGDLAILTPSRFSDVSLSPLAAELPYKFCWQMLRYYEIGDVIAARSNYEKL